MLLGNVGHFNDLSPKLRNRLEEKVRGFGKVVRYKFNISKPNPDPQKYNGDTIWPNIYTLDPARFTITDKEEDRKDRQKVKNIAIIDGIDEKGIPNKFRKIRVEAGNKGIFTLRLEDDPEHIDIAMFLELHPKHENGEFFDKTKQPIFSRIDEKALATTQREKRTAKSLALVAAQKMSDKEVVDFADAMMWDSTEETDVLRNRIEEMAENEPVYFNELVQGNSIKMQAVVKRALDRELITYDPASWKFVWTNNQQPITVISPDGEKNHVEKMAEWLTIGGKSAEEIYKKIEGLVKV
jgi:hypothetical protein